MTEEIIEYELGDIDLISGKRLKSAVLVAKSWGQLSAARDNVIVLPTYYTGTHDSYAPLVGPGNVFDTNDYFVVSPNLKKEKGVMNVKIRICYILALGRKR